MIEHRSDTETERQYGWEPVARHDFEANGELDATIVTALGDDGCLDDGPLYPAVDVESAEQFLASADDASVIFSVPNYTVRVSTDGTVEARRETGDAFDVGSVE